MKIQRWEENRELITELTEDFRKYRKLTCELVDMIAVLIKQLSQSNRVGFRRPDQIKNMMDDLKKLKDEIAD